MKVAFPWLCLLVLLATQQEANGQTFYKGVDLSYANELEDCGAEYFDNTVARDPYAIFSEHGANLARFRLWHSPDWTDYSTLSDVKKSIARAKAANMQVILDFHYSDTWTDPGAQNIPASWAAVEELEVLADSLYHYTYGSLKKLGAENLLPDMVQLGNEINGNILMKEGEDLYPVNWSRNKFLLDKAADAVDAINVEFGAAIKIILHIAQPENALDWFEQAAANDIDHYDIIGLSYYPGWSTLSLREAAHHVKLLKEAHQKEVLIVETGYPWTLDAKDDANNVLGQSNLLTVYGDSPSPETQRDFLVELTYLVKENGGLGVVYWAPAWVSTDCSTQWGQGSHYENAAFFDFNNALNESVEFLSYDYAIKPTALNEVKAKFLVDMAGIDTASGVFITGDFTGEPWEFREMTHVEQRIFEYETEIPGRSEGAYIFYNNDSWLDAYQEKVPLACALYWGDHRKYTVKAEPVQYEYQWSNCANIEWNKEDDEVTGIHEGNPGTKIQVYPNPTTGVLHIVPFIKSDQFAIYDMTGHPAGNYTQFLSPGKGIVDMQPLKPGVYILKVKSEEGSLFYKIVKE